MKAWPNHRFFSLPSLPNTLLLGSEGHTVHPAPLTEHPEQLGAFLLVVVFYIMEKEFIKENLSCSFSRWT
jgi:hypothetical protein